MKLIDTVIFSLAIAFFIIGLHQSLTVGFELSYWLFMLSIGLLLWFNMRKRKRQEGDTPHNPKKKSKK